MSEDFTRSRSNKPVSSAPAPAPAPTNQPSTSSELAEEPPMLQKQSNPLSPTMNSAIPKNNNVATLSEEKPSSPSSSSKSTKVQFPFRLHQLLSEVEEEGNESIVSWLPDGKSFRVHNPMEFVDKVMPRFFNNQTKYKSFQRQLNMWGFGRVVHGKDRGACYHADFLRGRPELCSRMTRQKAKSPLALNMSEQHLRASSSSLSPIGINKAQSSPSFNNVAFVPQMPNHQQHHEFPFMPNGQWVNDLQSAQPQQQPLQQQIQKQQLGTTGVSEFVNSDSYHGGTTTSPPYQMLPPRPGMLHHHQPQHLLQSSQQQQQQLQIPQMTQIQQLNLPLPQQQEGRFDNRLFPLLEPNSVCATTSSDVACATTVPCDDKQEDKDNFEEAKSFGDIPLPIFLEPRPIEAMSEEKSSFNDDILAFLQGINANSETTTGNERSQTNGQQPSASRNRANSHNSRAA